jgi:hypothetical protein
MEVENGAVHNRRIHFHNLRKYLINHLSAYSSESQWKQVVGKKINESAYVSTDQLRNIYARAMKDIVINGGNGLKAKKLIELEEALLESQRRVTALETTNEVLRRRVDELENSQNHKIECPVPRFESTETFQGVHEREYSRTC